MNGRRPERTAGVLHVTTPVRTRTIKSRRNPEKTSETAAHPGGPKNTYIVYLFLLL